MNKLPSLSFSSLKQRYLKLNNKKRLIVLLSTLATVFLLWYLFLMMPLQSKSKKVNQRMFETLFMQIKSLQDNIIRLVQAIEIPSADNSKPEAIFYNTLLKQKDNGSMPINIDNVVKMLLKNKNGLKLIGFKTSIVEYNHPMKNPPFILHKIDLSFSGSFIHLATFLKRFENPTYPLYFNKMSYRIQKYPVGQLHLTILTLTANKSKAE